MIFNLYYSQYTKIVKRRLLTGLFPKPTELDFLEKSPIRAPRGAPASLSDDGRVPQDEILPAAPAEKTQNHQPMQFL
jgi:hypothetical protein